MTNEDILKEKLEYKMNQARYYKKQAEELKSIIDEAITYLEKMSYAPVVDNPKKDCM